MIDYGPPPDKLTPHRPHATAALPDSIAKPLLIQRLLVKCLVNAAVAGQVPIAGKKRSSRRSKCEQYFVWPHFLQADFWTGITSG